MLATVFESIPSTILIDIILIIIVTTVFAYIARLLKQPLIPAYIIAGAVLGPLILGVVRNQELILTLSEIGIALLLFFVGLEINIKKIKEVAKVAIIGGLLQIAITFGLGYFMSQYLGFNLISSIYLGLVVAFSSTMVVVKLLSDKEELDTLHGRIALGILLMQDLVIVLAIASLSTLDNFSIMLLGISWLKGIGLFALALLVGRFVFPVIFKFAAKSEELLLFCALSVAFLFSLIALVANFSVVIGAFVAGLSLAVLPYHIDIAGKVKSLKDFFALLFFVSLGLQLYITDGVGLLRIVLFFLAAILIIKPILIMIIVHLFGYEERTSFLSGISLAQVSEFSLILMALGLSYGHVGSDLLFLTVLLTFISIGSTAYVISYDTGFYRVLKPLFKFLSKFIVKTRKYEYAKKVKPEVLLIGAHRMGLIFLKELKKKRVMIIDNDPEIIKNLMKKKINCLYGDASNDEVLRKAGVDKVKLVISTVPELEVNLDLLDYIHSRNKKAMIIVNARHLKDAFELYKNSAEYVILPHILSSEYVSSLLGKIKNKKEIKKKRKKHIKHLEEIEFLEKF